MFTRYAQIRDWSVEGFGFSEAGFARQTVFGGLF